MEMTYEKYPWVDNMFLWNLNFAVTWSQTNPPQPLHEQAAFAILNGDWTPRPSYLAVQETIDEIQAAQERAEAEGSEGEGFEEEDGSEAEGSS
jgi:hypothetical protein